MSGFDPAWLDLREPADHRSRSRDVLDRVAAAFEDRAMVSVADLAAGSGSTLRALAPRLGARQRWTLIDHDAGLLAHARKRLADWAEVAEEAGDRLKLSYGRTAIEVVTVVADLSVDPLPAVAERADLVTASALFDLVGEAWLAQFAARLAEARRPLYAALTYDGRTSFDPVLPLDRAVIEEFHRHQRTDKGFGPALGPAAHRRLGGALATAGFEIVEGDSPWRLAGPHYPLVRALVRGMAEAVGEMRDAPENLSGWTEARLASAMEGSVEIGHHDLFAEPV